jgi:hypothetical protein
LSFRHPLNLFRPLKDIPLFHNYSLIFPPGRKHTLV